jgi:FkbM family methyltransferase
MDDGSTLVVDLRRRMCFGYFFNGSLSHELGTERLIRHALASGHTFVDVGANIGYYSRMASALVGSTGRVVAIEPLPSALRILSANVCELPNVTVMPIAVGKHRTQALLYERRQGDTSSLSWDPAAAPIEIRMETLDFALKGEERVDLVKIDIEGFELAALRGAAQTILRHRPMFILEYLPALALAAGVQLIDLQQFFAEFGYLSKWIDHSPNAAGIASTQPSSDLVAYPRERSHLLGATPLCVGDRQEEEQARPPRGN